MLTVFSAPILTSTWTFFQNANASVPDDISIWQGLSLALVFNILTTVLRAFKIIPDGPLKKSIGMGLVIVGALVGGVYALTAGDVNTPMDLFKLLAGGAAAGLTATGAQSSVKNFREGLQLLRDKN